MTEQRHLIPEIGISLEIRPDWVLESFIEADHGNIYQLIADTGGIFFVRYGPEEAMEAFISRLSDLITSVTLQSDEELSYCGEKARRVGLIAEKQSLGIYRRDPRMGLIHRHQPVARTFISATGFNLGGVPVIVGYRLPEAHLEAYRPLVERMVESVQRLPVR